MFNTKIPIYGIFILLALISNIIVVYMLSKKYSYTKKEIICLLLYENAGIIGGAKIFTYITNYNLVNNKFNFSSLGLSSMGAVIGLLIFLALFCFQFKKSFKEILYIFLPPVPLMYAIGKVGCFLTGCCYGIEYSGIFKIAYKYSLEAPNNVYLFPVQIFESIIFIIIFIYLIYKKNKYNILTIGQEFILCGIAKFCLDFFRMSHINVFLSLNQIMCILFIIIGTIIILKRRKGMVM